MYKKTMILLVSYIKSIKADLEVYDATTEFKEPENYASIYITSITPTTPFENWVGREQIHDKKELENSLNLFDSENGICFNNNACKPLFYDEKPKIQFTYKETSYINIRVDFRGDEASKNIALFKSSFVREVQQALLQEAGFGYLGLSPISPINSLRDSKMKQGMTVSLKLISSEIVVDESQIAKQTEITVSKI